MPNFFFLVRCPGCGHDMKYHTPNKLLADRRKSCVYCGKSFKVRDHVVKEL